jgi:FKBP-type peptidyl-prolyl cis-trans isomerase
MIRKWMNRPAVLAVALLAAIAGCTSGQTPAKTPDKTAVAAPAASAKPSMALNTAVDKMSYSLGVETARSFKKQGIEINPDAMNQGMKDMLAGGQFLMSNEELRYTLSAFQAEVRAKQVQARMNISQDNKKEGEAFLTANQTKEGVMTLPSGLQYKILKEGNGPKPTDSNTVECYYRGTLIDGTEFDSSAHSNNEGFPATVNLASCIPGWREAIPLMPVGSKWQLFIPPELAYGINGSGRYIGPNATLIFEVELVAIK